MFCQNLAGRELSEKVYNSLTISTSQKIRLELAQTYENSFAYNILIPIRKSEGIDFSNSRSYNTLLFIFPQEDALDNIQLINNFIKWNFDTDFDFNVNILLTAADKSPLSGNADMTGSDIYAELIEGTESYCAFYFNLDGKKNTSITPGGASSVAPLWAIDLVNSSFERQGISPLIIGNFFISLYKLNILKSTKIANSFLSRNIPIIQTSVLKENVQDETFYKVLQDIVNSFSTLKEFQQDTHYIPIKFFYKHYWITETVTIIFLLVFFCLSLINICDLAFIFRNKHSRKTLFTKKAIKTLWFFPLTVFLMTCCLMLGQIISNLFYNKFIKNPFTILALKTLIAFIFISLLFMLKVKLSKKNRLFVYEYLLSISCFFNVFLFSAIDISLFYLFFIMYLIISLSKLFKKPIFLYSIFALSFLPYLHLVISIFLYSTPSLVRNLLYATPLHNLVFAFAITPLCFILFKIYISLNKNFKAKSFDNVQEKIKSKFSKHYIFTQLLLITFFVIVIAVTSNIIKNTFIKKLEVQEIFPVIIESSHNHYLKTDYTDSNYYGGTIRKLLVNTTKKALRVEIFVTGQTQNPIYYTTYPYSQTDKNAQIQFNISDNPPEEFYITYTPDNSNITIVDIFAYYDSDIYPENSTITKQNKLVKNYYKEKSSIVISSTQQDFINE